MAKHRTETPYRDRHVRRTVESASNTSHLSSFPPPAGELVTYSSLAELMGHPRATRAAATCCSHNPIPFFIPCHRVIPMEIENSLMAGRWPTHFGKFMGKPQLKTALVEAEFNHIS
ncbi:MGMT family protein [Arcanobacterium canis]